MRSDEPDRPGWLNLNNVTPESLEAWAKATRDRARFFWKNGVRYDRDEECAEAPLCRRCHGLGCEVCQQTGYEGAREP